MKKPKVKGPSEHVIQTRLMKTLESALKPELDARAIPNGGLRKRSVAIKLKAEGVKPGTPDIVVCLPEGRVGWLELKTDIGRLGPEQIAFRDKVLLLGHLWAIARSVDEAMTILITWNAIKDEWQEEDPYQAWLDAA